MNNYLEALVEQKRLLGQLVALDPEAEDFELAFDRVVEALSTKTKELDGMLEQHPNLRRELGL